jgi:hypothetical protein
MLAMLTAAVVLSGSPAQARVLPPADLPGFAAARVKVISNPWAWAQGNAYIRVVELRRLGFAEAALEFLTPTAAERRDQVSAISTVVRLGSARAAKAYLARMVANLPDDNAFFPVPGISGARGSSNGTTYDVLFASGRFFYDLTVTTIDPHLPPSRAQTAAAALRWYRDVRG